ncbi:MAG: AAA family ATPase [Candidatus Aminicenantes bacterium]|nr:AAA family ATPase [Candidatus Aminicenantes bacterium]
MERAVDQELTRWKQDEQRKVLLVRGARQVGKTYSIRKLGQGFENFVEVNFEEIPGVKTFFEKSLNPHELCEKLSIYFKTPLKPGQTLLFLDEIQACPNAIRSLRFFYEKMPELHVVAAGSLLEFALEEIPSFAVGRIKSLFMYPMTFNEFLIAAGEERLEKLILKSSPENPIDPILHEITLDKLKIFQLLGGMPAVVKTYLEEKDLALCQEVIDDILTTIKDDFAKYKKKFPVVRLQEVFDSIVYQSGNKFKYSNISGEKCQVYKDALELLVKAGLAHKVYHTAARGVPLGAQLDDKKFKVLLLDTGIYQRVLGLDISSYIVSDFSSIINKGNLAELFVGLELIAHGSQRLHPELYYWHREARSSNAEVDYVISRGGTVIPIEVKSGSRGQMQSMHIFLSERNLAQGIRISGENFSGYDKIKTFPLYAIKNILHSFR